VGSWTGMLGPLGQRLYLTVLRSTVAQTHRNSMANLIVLHPRHPRYQVMIDTWLVASQVIIPKFSSTRPMMNVISCNLSCKTSHQDTSTKDQARHKVNDPTGVPSRQRHQRCMRNQIDIHMLVHTTHTTKGNLRQGQCTPCPQCTRMWGQTAIGRRQHIGLSREGRPFIRHIRITLPHNNNTRHHPCLTSTPHNSDIWLHLVTITSMLDKGHHRAAIDSEASLLSFVLHLLGFC